MTFVRTPENRAALIATCEGNSKDYMLCAWCRTWKTRLTDQNVLRLTDEEFKCTRVRNDVSHGCCSSCAKTLMRKTDSACASKI